VLTSTARRLEPDERVALARALTRLAGELDPDQAPMIASH
jgi:hypothetical protein